MLKKKSVYSEPQLQIKTTQTVCDLQMAPITKLWSPELNNGLSM